MDARSTPDLAALAPLADPVRRRLYEHVVAQGAPVDRDAAAAAIAIGRPLAAFHLDRLAAAGLLEVEYRRRTGRTGPGAGRPAKYYRRARARRLSVSLPPRHYDLAAEILAEGVERHPETAGDVLEAARRRGAELADTKLEGARREALATTVPASAAPPGTSRPVAPPGGSVAVAAELPPSDAPSIPADAPGGPAALLALLSESGFEPFADAGGVVRLRNCPFDALAEQHRGLTCSMNLALLDGLAMRLGDTGMRAEGQPREGLCCVAFVPIEPGEPRATDGSAAPGSSAPSLLPPPPPGG